MHCTDALQDLTMSLFLKNKQKYIFIIDSFHHDPYKCGVDHLRCILGDEACLILQIAVFHPFISQGGCCIDRKTK